MGNELEIRGQTASGGEGGSGGVLWIAGRVLEGNMVRAGCDSLSEIPCTACQTSVSSAVLRCSTGHQTGRRRRNHKISSI